MIDVDLLKTNYQEIITTFVLNKMLHHVGMIWIIENHEQLQYDMDIQNSYWMTGGPCYNTSIFKKLHGNCLRDLLSIQELTDIITCVLSVLAFIINTSNSFSCNFLQIDVL